MRDIFFILISPLETPRQREGRTTSMCKTIAGKINIKNDAANNIVFAGNLRKRNVMSKLQLNIKPLITDRCFGIFKENV